MMKNLPRILFAILAGSIPFMGIADTYTEIEERVVEHELRNGMRFLIFERHEAPLVSMVIAVKAGAVNEVTNKTGIAHFLEHLAFKGTQTIGTKNYRAERKVLKELDAAFKAYHKAEQEGADSEVLETLYAEFKQRQEKASSYIVQGELSEIYDRNGATRFNASTGYDYTTYIITLPSNRFELWCGMESDRMANPVFREFYSERDVILEERRMRTDNSPRGLFFEEYRSVSYKAHPYGQPILGHLSDMENLYRQDVRAFYETYYVPQHMTAAIVGDVNAEEIIPLIDKYFGRIPKRPDPPGLITKEPEQPGVRRVQMHIGRQPRLYMGFSTVPEGHEDELVLDLLASVLGQGRTSRLYRSLVEERKLASSVRAGHTTMLYAGQLGFSGTPIEGVTAAELEEAVLGELAELKENPITEEELDAARARWKVRIYTYLSSNLGMGYMLAQGDQGNTGWQDIFRIPERAEKITPQDLMDAAERYIDPDKRSVGLMEVAND
ncbi:MAG: insulinase family protein [Candidatus Stahlbacteria bacterium]|nr:MAG: insulinase family protein [Candidatus Stahlbacteria bacterium]